eukprot:6174283-Alexandrium_andersonii.AAC.1
MGIGLPGHIPQLRLEVPHSAQMREPGDEDVSNRVNGLRGRQGQSRRKAPVPSHALVHDLGDGRAQA